ncbi:RodZ domain-containing protein [Bowmanella yangjiangensis]|uniref:DUF4115 domain-containing protein n=1 Tax=Bowmanella yangjiangensis TaxID=2811230 RepID=A0ABS3CNW9_9ALTE|nr:RodZ domain-containing protein [Bowmanella yangjiangensis]MBN7818796.1 DUF4115 domain-containing protein [Bowmanella yangjiangensis]
MTDEQVAEQTQAMGPGQMLREARVAKGLTVEDVANRLNLKSSNVQDLEAEKFDERISVTFIRGYYKNYAKLLDVPQADVQQAFDALNAAQKEPAKLQSFSRKVAKQASDDRLMMVSYVILAIILALVVIWWLQQSNTSATETVPASSTFTSAPQTKASEQSEQPVQPDMPVEEQQVVEQPSLDVVRSEDTSAVEPQLVDDTTALAAEASLPELIGELPAQVELVFQFSADCWVNIMDATGEAIAFGVKKAGRTMPVSGVPPFEITLGAPDVVQIQYDGEAVDMTGFPKGRTAKFNLPLN